MIFKIKCKKRKIFRENKALYSLYETKLGKYSTLSRFKIISVNNLRKNLNLFKDIIFEDIEFMDKSHHWNTDGLLFFFNQNTQFGSYEDSNNNSCLLSDTTTK